MKLTDGRWTKKESFDFHITTKDMLRQFIDSDGKEETLLDELPFDERLAMCEAGDGGNAINEDFLNALCTNYIRMYDKYHEAITSPEDRLKLQRRTLRLIQFTIAMYRNDSAYFERIGGIIQFIVNNHERFAAITNIDQEHSKLLMGVHRWWYVNDKRKRTHMWIDWAFTYAIRKYKTDMFYRRSINMCLIFITSNYDKWKFDEVYDPRKWFPAYRGKLANALFANRF